MYKKHSFIFGAGGHANVIASELSQGVLFVVPVVNGENQISEDQFFKSIIQNKNHDIYIGIGDNNIRRKIFNKLQRLDVIIATFISTNAFISSDAVVGEGAVLCSGSVVGSKAIVGCNTIINTLSSLDHNCSLGDHSQITSGVILGGSVNIGKNCFLGIRCTALPNLTIGHDVIVMAGSLVTKSIQDKVVVGGSPARIVKKI